MDHLTNGRFILGLGVSGPQVVEGGTDSHTRNLLPALANTFTSSGKYVNAKARLVCRRALSDAFPGWLGARKPLKSTVHPLRQHIPIYLGAEGPKMWPYQRKYVMAGCPYSSLPKTTSSTPTLSTKDSQRPVNLE